jgi:hypothetical protein
VEIVVIIADDKYGGGDADKRSFMMGPPNATVYRLRGVGTLLYPQRAVDRQHHKSVQQVSGRVTVGDVVVMRIGVRVGVAGRVAVGDVVLSQC